MTPHLLLPRSIPINTSSAFEAHDPRFHSITGANPALTLLLSSATNTPFAHEASVYIAGTNTLYLTSNILTDSATNTSSIQISKIALDNHPLTAEVLHLTPAIPNPNGATAHDNGILFCGQGTATAPAGLYQLTLDPPNNNTVTPVLTSFYSRPFNSPNDVAIHPADDSIWFTDPDYGYIQGLRPAPQLPNQVYRFEPSTGAVRVVADGFDKPNGIAFAPDGLTLYVTDTGAARGDGTVDLARVATIYAFDIRARDGEPFLTNRRVFAMADAGVPDGIKVDADGNVYAGCGDGVNVWSAGGVLLGKILVEGGVANFGFAGAGRLFLMGETRLWEVLFGEH